MFAPVIVALPVRGAGRDVLVHRGHGRLGQQVVAGQTGHLVARGAVHGPDADAGHHRRGAAAGADVGGGGDVGGVKGQGVAAGVQRRGVAVEQPARDAAGNGRAGGDQQAVIGLVRAGDRGAAGQGRRRDVLVHRGHGRLGQQVVAGQTGHLVARGAVHGPDADAGHHRRGAAAGADVGGGGDVGGVKGQGVAAGVQRRGVAVEQPARDAAGNGRAGGDQQAVIGLVRAGDRGAAGQGRRRDVLVHRGHGRLGQQVVAGQTGHLVARGAVHGPDADAGHHRRGAAAGADVGGGGDVGGVKGQGVAAGVQRRGVAVEQPARDAAGNGRAGGDQQAVIGLVRAGDRGAAGQGRHRDVLVHRGHGRLGQQVVAGQTGHLVARGAVHGPDADAGHHRRGAAAGADVGGGGDVGGVKGQGVAAGVQRRGVAVEQPARDAAGNGRAGGDQQAVIGLVRAGDRGAAGQGRRRDGLVHRGHARLGQQIVAGQPRHLVARGAVL